MSKESIFNRSSKRRIATSYFDLSHNFAGTYYPGYLYPVFAKKVIPGDTWQMASSPFLRSQPFVSPLMSNVYCDIRYFYCRNQLVWKNFDMYLTNSHKRGRGDLDPREVPVHPYLDYDTAALNTYVYRAFFDYMYGAVDPGNIGHLFAGLDALPARIYNMIWNEYYSNENYDLTAFESESDGSVSEADCTHYRLRHACYKKDYFTSMLPSPQRGAGVSLEGLVNLRKEALTPENIKQLLVSQSGSKLLNDGVLGQHLAGDVKSTETRFGSFDVDNTFLENAYLDPNGSFGVSIDINDLRKAGAVQRFLERSAVNGNRYAEYMLSQFGVRIPDNSSYRPMYLGGGSQIVNYSPVEQNSETATTPQGTLAGRGTLRGLMGMNHRWFFTEPGWIMALMVIRPEALYVGGVNRQMYTNQDRFEDYVIPGFQNIGMQSVKRRELQAGDPSSDLDDIGYQERYMEYKSIPSSVHGDLITAMKSWFAMRDFTYSKVGAPVQINSDFMHVNYDAFDDNSAVAKYPPFIVDIHHSIGVRRPLEFHAKYGGIV